MNRDSGFTLTEILVVMVIVMIVAAVAVPIYQNYTINAETVELVNALEAIELEVRAPAVPRDGPVTCDNKLVNSANLVSNYLELSIGSTPNNPLDYTKGFAATLHINAADGKKNTEGVRVARAFYEELKVKQPTQLVSGATVTESIVSFSILLSLSGDHFCDPAQIPGTKRQPTVTKHVTTPIPTPIIYLTPSQAAILEPKKLPYTIPIVVPIVAPIVVPILPTQTTPALPSNAKPTPQQNLTPTIVNQPPVVGNVQLGHMTPPGIRISTNSLLSATNDPDGDPVKVQSLTSSQGHIIANSSGDFSFFPNKGFVGSAKLSFEVSDGRHSVTGTATIIVDLPLPTCAGGQHLSADHKSCIKNSQPAACAQTCRHIHPHGNGIAYRTCLRRC